MGVPHGHAVAMDVPLKTCMHLKRAPASILKVCAEPLRCHGMDSGRPAGAAACAMVRGMRVFSSYAELAACKGQQVAVSDWQTITQEQVNLFAQATGDHQWIHVDAERAAKGPFGTTIAHGFLTLSLLPKMMSQAVRIEGVAMGVNYGLNKVRFTSPVPVGSQLRARITLLEAQPLEQQGLQIGWHVEIERQGQDKPVCVAETIARVYGGRP